MMKKPNLKKLNVLVTAPPRIDATPKTHGVNPQRKAVVFPPRQLTPTLRLILFDS
jgi:hypothetical protein